MTDLLSFIRESNKIEGILREPSAIEIRAHQDLLSGLLTTEALEEFVSTIAPGHKLRRKIGLDVRVGSHIAPSGGPEIERLLDNIVDDAINGHDPYEIHQRYEHLHPFTDGNGRSGRAIWLWMLADIGVADKAYALGFLHHWYYQSLSRWRAK